MTNIVSDSDSGLVHRGCSHEPFLGGVAVTVSGSEEEARVSVGLATVYVGSAVLGASDVDPQAITASMIVRQDAIRTL